MALLLVRHAAALSRRTWRSSDASRPLTDRGHAQAVALVDRLRHFDVAHVYSSPATRCYQTIAPLAASRALPIVPARELFEGAVLDGVRFARALATAEKDVVLCSHGDVVPAILESYLDEGVDLGVAPACEKGSTWILDFAAPGGAPAATYLPPTDVMS